MALGKVIFTRDGHFSWYDDDTMTDLVLLMADKKFLGKECFIAELSYPDNVFDYDVSMHDVQIRELLAKPDELVPFDILENLRAKEISAGFSAHIPNVE